MRPTRSPCTNRMVLAQTCYERQGGDAEAANARVLNDLLAARPRDATWAVDYLGAGRCPGAWASRASGAPRRGRIPKATSTVPVTSSHAPPRTSGVPIQVDGPAADQRQQREERGATLRMMNTSAEEVEPSQATGWPCGTNPGRNVHRRRRRPWG